ncbi:hypothetical protein CCM_04052 [Cordyceps militaris CM01]|uniref:Uncharacterized protein n=1 Tax=Cordyceps militaris (strain CM01) TaxID=983644 RepID=G3JDK4_CORMM|nr:uncharacterized protein CCM_04052 [Cordyceps militaris CM01]EGX92679.1 hypothetical protein CCM_04052 [Cordyceps militaris CM01]
MLVRRWAELSNIMPRLTYFFDFLVRQSLRFLFVFMNPALCPSSLVGLVLSVLVHQPIRDEQASKFGRVWTRDMRVTIAFSMWVSFDGASSRHPVIYDPKSTMFSGAPGLFSQRVTLDKKDRHKRSEPEGSGRNLCEQVWHMPLVQIRTQHSEQSVTLVGCFNGRVVSTDERKEERPKKKEDLGHGLTNLAATPRVQILPQTQTIENNQRLTEPTAIGIHTYS